MSTITQLGCDPSNSSPAPLGSPANFIICAARNVTFAGVPFSNGGAIDRSKNVPDGLQNRYPARG
jgi:hypothetical protein